MVEETIIEDYFDLKIDVPVIKYYIRFDRESGRVTEVFPRHNHIEEKDCLEIDSDLAVDLLTGIKTLTSVSVDISQTPFNIVEHLNQDFVLSKIDNVLHRVIEKKWSKISRPDVRIIYNRKEEELIFKINPSIKETHWPGEKEMIFLITGYNDPNNLKEMIKFSIDELSAYPQKFKLKLRSKFSIFTRRLFSNYTLEIK